MAEKSEDACCSGTNQQGRLRALGVSWHSYYMFLFLVSKKHLEAMLQTHTAEQQMNSKTYSNHVWTESSKI